MICVSIGNLEFSHALRLCNEESFVEIRADLLNLESDQLDKLLDTTSKKVFTFRKSDSDSNLRKEFYKQAIKRKVDYVDFDFYEDTELFRDIRSSLNMNSVKLILSHHNYDLTPPVKKLKEYISEMNSEQPDIVKIACKVNKDEDMVNLLALYRNPIKKIVLGMGEKGVLTRVASMFMGAPFTFASVDEGNKTAPGQLRRNDLEEIYRIMNPSSIR